MKALVVEDDKDILDIVSGYLKDLDLSVETASSAEEAIEKMASNRFDFYFVDIILPQMNGIELTKKIISHDKNSKVAVMTGGGEGIDIVNQILLDAAVHKGALHSLAKPFTYDDIADLVTRFKS
jgi:DNA-binding NtrC family response regulator